MAIAAIEQLLDPSYVDGVAEMSMDDLRSRRDECQHASDALSYLRRMVQGRLDLVHAELERRLTGTKQDLGDIVEELKKGGLLSDGIRPPGLGRLPQSFEPADADGWIAAELDEILDANRLAELGSLEEAELRTVADGLGRIERRVSDQRAQLHQRTDAFQEEIVRRYKSGEANVDSLFK
jgi:hypothetical protein